MKLFEKIYFTLCFVLMFAMPAKAYIDPSVATYTVQVIAGVAVVVAAMIGGILYLNRSYHNRVRRRERHAKV